MKIAFTLFLVFILSWIIILILKRIRKPRLNTDEYSGYKILLGKALEDHNVELADQAYQNMISYVENENTRNENAYFSILKNLKVDYNIFKTQNHTSCQQKTTHKTAPDETYKELSQQAVFMSRKATKIKKENLYHAIDLLQESVRINPEKNIQDHFKLASCLAGTGKFEEADKIYKQLLIENKQDDIYNFHHTNQKILEKRCYNDFLRKNYNAYLKNYILLIINNIIHLACKGDTENFHTLIRTKDKTMNFTPSRLNSVLKKTKGIQKDAINGLVDDFIHENAIELNNILDKTSNYFTNRRLNREKYTRHFFKDKSFMAAYKKFSSQRLEMLIHFT